VSNLFQIGQQGFLLRAGHIGPDALDRRIAEQKARAADQPEKPAKKGFMAGMMERADKARQQSDGGGKGGSSGRETGKGSQPKGTSGSGGTKGGPRKPPPKNQPRPKPRKPGGTDGS